MKYKAVLFDWNGVIIDDLDAVARANCDIIFELGGQKVGPETWFHEITQDWHAFFIDKGVKKEDIDKVLPMMKQYYPKYSEYIKLVDGVKEVLEFLHNNNYKIGILSGVDRHGINTNIKNFNLEKYFDFVISGEDVKNPKPHTEGLKTAIKNFNTNPEDILYIDDMATIFEQAKKIGVKTVGFKSRISDDLSQADLILKDIKALIDIISK